MNKLEYIEANIWRKYNIVAKAYDYTKDNTFIVINLFDDKEIEKLGQITLLVNKNKKSYSSTCIYKEFEGITQQAYEYVMSYLRCDIKDYINGKKQTVL